MHVLMDQTLMDLSRIRPAGCHLAHRHQRHHLPSFIRRALVHRRLPRQTIHPALGCGRHVVDTFIHRPLRLGLDRWRVW